MHEAYKYAALSPCLKRQVGSVVVKDQLIIAYGFNHGYAEECTCSFENKNPNVIHAEQMALSGLDTEVYKNASIYVTYQPCMQCAELIVSKGITSVYYNQLNQCDQSIRYLNEHKVSTQVLK